MLASASQSEGGQDARTTQRDHRRSASGPGRAGCDYYAVTIAVRGPARWADSSLRADQSLAFDVASRRYRLRVAEPEARAIEWEKDKRPCRSQGRPGAPGLGAARARNDGVGDALQLTHDMGEEIPMKGESDGGIGQTRASNMKLLAWSQMCVDEHKQYLRRRARCRTLDLH